MLYLTRNCNKFLLIRFIVVLLFVLCLSTLKRLNIIYLTDSQILISWDQPNRNDGVGLVETGVNPNVVDGTKGNEITKQDVVDGHGDQRMVAFEEFINSRLRNLTTQRMSNHTREWFFGSSANKRAVFYNVYVPKKFEERTFRRIINDQVLYVQESIFGTAPLYYNLIGFNSMRAVCRSGMTCKRLRYIPEGNEVDTLQDMYDYCVDRPDHVVAYVHDKGSFHFSPSNCRVRRLATTAALSSECYNISEGDKNTCDVCSLNFNIRRHPHTSGNMFTAKCSYIKTLIPPNQFEIKRLQMIQDLLTNASLSNQFSCLRECILKTVTGSDNRTIGNTDLPEIWLEKMLSLGRYTYESWVYSSPMVEPCDVYDGSIATFVTGGEAWIPKLSKARFAPVLQVSGIDKLDFLQGYGKLYEYFKLYGTAPGQASWFWQAWKNYLEPFQQVTCPC
jgi:hypothetical protein